MEAQQRLRLRIKRKHSQLIGRPAIGNHLVRRLKGPRPQVAPPHAGTRVDQQGDPPPLDVAESQPSRLAQERPGKGKSQQTRAAARKSSRSKWSSRLRRVSRGGVGDRNISELNGTSPRGDRRIK